MTGKKRITAQKEAPSKEEKLAKLKKRHTEYKGNYNLQYCFGSFIAEQLTKNNSKQTIAFYNRFFTKFTNHLQETFDTTPKDTDAEHLSETLSQYVFIEYMKAQGCNEQTVNSYLRGYRAFGKHCLKQGYIDSFDCPIKEVAPPIKNVYTDEELNKLLTKPKIDNFVEFRTYAIISLILNTGARCRTVLELKIRDIDFSEGYINFNSLKNNSVVRLGLDRRTSRDLQEWVRYWRTGTGATEDDYVFSSDYGEQLSRSQLWHTFARYNRSRGVEKTSIHLLRHTFAKKWITSGGDIITLAHVLTHSELEMVKRYSNLYGTDVKKAMESHSAIAQIKQKSGKTLRGMKND